jgi:hypothetical protein
MMDREGMSKREGGEGFWIERSERSTFKRKRFEM